MTTERKDGREPADDQGNRRYTGNPQKFDCCGPETQATIGAWWDAASQDERQVLIDGPSLCWPSSVIFAFIRAHDEGRDLMHEVAVRMAELRNPGHASAMAARKARKVKPFDAVEVVNGQVV